MTTQLNSVLPLQMSDGEFAELCRRLEPMSIELTKEGLIRMMAPAGNESSDANSEIITQLRNWWKTHRSGRVFDSNTLFTLPDGSRLGPDAAYITSERLTTIPRDSLRGFGHVCPNFVIELLSATDSPKDATEKMHNWVANGVEVGWLLDPYERVSYVFGERSYSTKASGLEGSGPVKGFTLDLTEVWGIFTR
ncbi:MAG TPA: Uma2 family endonuclease [Silvibacterium sp.]|nr:Uma2 family endonuclease [Silvibacterium sp.]